jgi:DNA-binding winged helix-turn-helix (wHTH) protein
MALKIAELANDKPIPWPVGMTRIEVSGGGEELQHSADSLLRDAMRRFADELPVLRKRTDMVDTGNYQIALIPLRDLMNQSGSDAPALARMNSVLVLPLTWKDLVTRLRAEVGRSKSNQTNDVVGFGTIRMKLSTMEVFRSGEPMTFRRREFKLLQYFISNPAKVISRDELLNEVWGLDNYPCTRTVDSHVWRLRQKLEPDPARPIHFHTVHAVGYKFLP